MLFEKQAAIKENTSAEDIPAAQAVNPPVKMPMKPFSPTAVFTPSARR